MYAVVSSWHTMCSCPLPARKGRKAVNTRLEICLLGNFWNIKWFGGPLAIQDALVFKSSVLIVFFTTEAVSEGYYKNTQEYV